jgi:hypothetical protein
MQKEDNDKVINVYSFILVQTHEITHFQTYIFL